MTACEISRQNAQKHERALVAAQSDLRSIEPTNAHILCKTIRLAQSGHLARKLSNADTSRRGSVAPRHVPSTRHSARPWAGSFLRMELVRLESRSKAARPSIKGPS
jgi:hypothetical protein